MSNKIYVVGLGPGKKEYMTGEAVSVIESADIVIGYTVYIDIIKEIFPQCRYLSTPMKKEIDRCRIAVEHALAGETVAVVSSGDSGVYGMAGIMYETAFSMNADVDIIPVAGITAAMSAASLLGAPIMHDFSAISLSDLMTPLDKIFTRVDCAAKGDFVICFYNPKSKKRTDYLERSAEIIMRYRDGKTPVGIVRNAGRNDVRTLISSLENLKNEEVDMFSIVIVGNSQTYVKNGKMITPRGYIEKYGQA